MHAMFTIFTYVPFGRSIKKIMLRTLTGQCEIQRCLNANNLAGLKYSLLMSRQLPTLSENIRNRKCDLPTNYEDTVIRIKRIRQKEKFYELFPIAMNKIIAPFRAQNEIINLQKTKYDKKNKEHERDLEKLWNLTMPKDQIYIRVTDDWQKIGFQGNDPSTDFRGGGYLALKNLIYISDVYSEECKRAIEFCKETSEWIFFAVCGIIATTWCTELLADGSLDEYFYYNTDGMTTFNEIYSLVLLDFMGYLKREKPKMMQFHIYSQHYQRRLRVRLNEVKTQLKANILINGTD